MNQDFHYEVKHEYCLYPLRYLLGEKLVKLLCHRNVLERKNHFVLEIPFVLEVELLDMANPFVLEGAFFYFFQPSLVFEKTIKAAVQPKDTN